MTINILIAFVLIYVGHQTRNLEISNLTLKNKIDEKENEININQIEFSLYNDNKYLKKLFSIYETNLEKKELSNIISLSEFSNFEKKDIFKVGFK
ncbi:uncharacterized protein METZ01_LOCUS358257 [marine metagenome]|uniref:Uncharacterized protein n=1 Tax=marine metagenome TaxID=408172 RepID=A0A382S694_9ZZZZ